MTKGKADGPQWGPRDAMTLLNHNLRRVDGPEKVSGRARYTHDIRLPGMVYARLLLCPLPTAQVELDCSAASKLRGVFAARGLGGKTSMKTGFLGQPIAVVAAETPELAEDAVRAIQATYKALPWSVTPEQALSTEGGKVKDNGNLGKPATEGDEDKFKKAFDSSAAKVEGEFHIPIQHHCSLETHGVVVDFNGGETATVYASTQGTFTVSGDAADALGLKASQVTTIVDYMGGGFGSKFGLGVEGLTACELARELKRPVHLMMTREDEFLAAGNRSGSIVKLKVGADSEGRLIALDGDVMKLGGIGGGAFNKPQYAYSLSDSKPPSQDEESGKPARPSKDGLHTSIRSLYMHTDSSRAMRAPGHPQTSFPIESVIDDLAYQLKIDPVTMRKKNLANEVHPKQLDRVAERIGWAKHPNKTAPQEQPDADGTKTGIGFAVTIWGSHGGAGCECKVAIGRDGSLQSIVGSQDLGTGTRTYVAAIAAEEFGLPLSACTAKIGNSNYGNANPSGGSSTVPSLAPAVKSAAYKAAQAFLEHLAGVVKRPIEELEFRGGSLVDAKVLPDAKEEKERKAGKGPKALMTWKEACATLGAAGISGEGRWDQSLTHADGVHGAQGAKVKVDLATGRVQVLQMVGVQDCGLPLNRTAVESQLNGGMIQALSYALHEERVIDPALGLMLNANFNDYKLAGCQEMPEFVPLIDEDDIGRGPIGMAEPAVTPGHSAIANAICNACGVRLHSMPFTADKILDGLAALAAKGGTK
ncbi:MAG TPA: xanthine dehydrogenase family protein molybdopterin-binding subunit [Planctomycetota bacterium]|nr:xanthine dehydrogenase family protein molybdopterin-binding subunit [Planctomycetota bacterium]